VASPETQIVFRGVPIARVGWVVVTGSRSGVRKGRLLADSDGRGGGFVPHRPFLPGERVTVRTQSRLFERGARFSFRIAEPAGATPDTRLPAIPRVPGDVLSFDLASGSRSWRRRDHSAR